MTYVVPDPIDVSNEDYENINWRIYIALCALPMAIVLVFFIVSGELAPLSLSLSLSPSLSLPLTLSSLFSSLYIINCSLFLSQQDFISRKDTMKKDRES